MNSEKMGKFIAELRKSKQMTQKDMAQQLNITDKAVSKWERGLSCPDISLLTDIAEILGISVSELLNGERNNIVDNDVEENVDNAITYAEENAKQKNNRIHSICAGIFTVCLLIALMVCVICDYSVSNKFSWSLYPISSVIFAWTIVFPLILIPKKGITISLISLSVFVIPFLCVINRIVKTGKYILPIGIRVSIISICLLWCIYALFRIFSRRKFLASGISLFISVIAYFFIQAVVSDILLEDHIDIWDIASCILLLIAGICCIIRDCRKQTYLY
jgi:transcriptional regulator, XRE family